VSPKTELIRHLLFNVYAHDMRSSDKLTHRNNHASKMLSSNYKYICGAWLRKIDRARYMPAAKFSLTMTIVKNFNHIIYALDGASSSNISFLNMMK
jgi:hypothetical protein